MKVSKVSGSVEFPLTEQIRNTIEVHGLKFAVQYYSKRMSLTEFRFFMRAAYL